MATADINDDLLTCSVCFNEFDDESHKPKFLACHHTLCLQCVKSMSVRMSLTCPLCRKDTPISGNGNQLANNVYVLQMIANNNHSSQLSKEQWCLKCNKVATKSCISSSDHATFIMGPKSPQFCRQLQTLKDENENQMADVISKRKEAKQYYDELSKSLETVQDTVKKLNEENDLHLAEMVSLLESSGTDIFIKNESALSLSKKLQESSLLLKQELKVAQDLDDQLKSTTITVHLNHREKGDLPSIVIPPISDGNPTSKSLLLASHLLLSEPPTSTPDQNAAEHANSSNSSNDEEQQGSGFFGQGGDVFTTYLNETSTGFLVGPGIDFTKSVFVMNFSQCGRALGAVQIQPNFHFCRNFGHALGQFSLTSPKQFEAKIEKAHPGSFAVMSFFNPLFKTNIWHRQDPQGIFECYRKMGSYNTTQKALQVGFHAFDHEGENLLTRFQLIFLVKDYDARLMGPASPLFGWVLGDANVNRVLDLLSRKGLNERGDFEVAIKCYTEV